MKRGRPNIRQTIQTNIITILDRMGTPITISTLLREITTTISRKVSWNTIQKYTQELVESGRIQATQLPHSKKENQNGLVVYTLKK
ncbi:MAG: hypothetical protein HYS62_00830 [Candidatus Aenigmarchaeota archaeon]|nr:hypothetical protein [Candidatus Aenigmarchaeota archaeon]